MSVRLWFKTWVAAIFWVYGLTVSASAQQEPIEIIEDNSFLIEEAYNQEPGVVQHIFQSIYSSGPRQRGWAFGFTQEWPIYGQDHQFSYTVLGYHLINEGQRQHGVGDTLLNYRYQVLEEGSGTPAFAPRFSLIVPTGNRDKGTGNAEQNVDEEPETCSLDQRSGEPTSYGADDERHYQCGDIHEIPP